MSQPFGESSRALYRLHAPVKDYAWGSTTLLAELTGAAASDSPQAEMWFGTHPTTPTRLDDGSALADIADLPYLSNSWPQNSRCQFKRTRRSIMPGLVSKQKTPQASR